MHDNGYSLLDTPGYLFFLRIAQVVIAIIALGLSAYAASIFSPYSSFVSLSPEGLTLFTAIATWIILIYIRVTSTVASTNKYYNYWADVACQAFLVIFWLVSMAVCAQWAASHQVYAESYYYDPYAGYYRMSKRTTFDQLKSARNCVAAAAGMCGLELVLFIITLVLTGLAVNRHMHSNTEAPAVDQPAVSMQSVPQQGAPAAYIPPSQQHETQAYQAPPGPTYQPEQTQAYPPQGQTYPPQAQTHVPQQSHNETEGDPGY